MFGTGGCTVGDNTVINIIQSRLKVFEIELRHVRG